MKRVKHQGTKETQRTQRSSNVASALRNLRSCRDHADADPRAERRAHRRQLDCARPEGGAGDGRRHMRGDGSAAHAHRPRHERAPSPARRRRSPGSDGSASPICCGSASAPGPRPPAISRRRRTGGRCGVCFFAASLFRCRTRRRCSSSPPSSRSFSTPARRCLRQIALLSLTFLLIAAIVDSGWALLSARVGGALKMSGRLRNRLTGGFLFGAG